MSELWPWIALALLGAYHGVNPGMGWLFAVALGLQEKSRQVVIKALFPIALGHALSIGGIVLLVGVAQVILPEPILRRLGASILFAFGLYRLFRSRHPRWVGMRVDFKDLVIWSFFMSSAHGAGLMLVPILLNWPASGQVHPHGMTTPLLGQMAGSPGLLLAATGIHTLSLLLVTGAVALLVYEKLGLALLRQAWFNLDLLWVIALMVAGGMILVF
ncbi:MAG TPA: hypothetical protein VNM22_20310 [Candidatus Limnocylindrales bacterium]|nr:hypothetical protein [Candidatus Limnocylindrales bacterium]